MDKTSIISKLIDGKFFIEYKKADELSINQVLLADIIEVTNYYKRHCENLEYFKLVRFFSDDYEEFINDLKFLEYTQDYFPKMKMEDYVSDFNLFYSWYLEKQKDSIIKVKSIEDIMEIYQELIKLD